MASWVFYYRFGGRRPKMGLGPLRDVSVEEARALADAARRLIRQGIDPLTQRESHYAKRSAAKTFLEAARAHLAKRIVGKKAAKSVEQQTMLLLGEKVVGGKAENNYCAALHHVPVGDITTAHILRVVSPIWETKHPTAVRLRAYIEAVIAYAIAAGLAGERDASWPNPARLAVLKDALAKSEDIHKTKHHDAMSFDAIPEFVAGLRRQTGVAARALEMLILTGLRSSEARGAQLSEFDFDKRVWTVPASRMKKRVEHKVPLTNRMIAIVRELGGADYVFGGRRPDQPISEVPLKALLPAGVTLHGFRSSLADWGTQRGGFSAEIMDSVLAHAVGSKVSRAYRRETFFEPRVRVMAAWGRFCPCDDNSADKIVALRA